MPDPHFFRAFVAGVLVGIGCWLAASRVSASSIGATSPTTWQVGGVPIARENTADFRASDGILFLSSNPGGKFQLQILPETAFALLSRGTHQAGTDTYCRSTTGDDSYKCGLMPELKIYTPGSCVVLNPDTANTGAAALDVDTLGSLPVLTHAGGTPANGDIPANLATLLCLNSDATAWSRP